MSPRTLNKPQIITTIKEPNLMQLIIITDKEDTLSHKILSSLASDSKKASLCGSSFLLFGVGFIRYMMPFLSPLLCRCRVLALNRDLSAANAVRGGDNEL